MNSTPAPSFQAPEIDQLAAFFPGYQITRLIACGGMGAVYQATQVSLDRPVAIKILPREFGSDPSFRASFELEARSMARLNHPNLVGVYDSGEVDGMLYIIMEYVPGESLHHATYGVKLKGSDAARLVASICDGLAHAHEHDVLHRDIKPANILLDAQAKPKIGDFGLARPLGRKEGTNETIFGTPGYTAPEVIARPEAVDARADIFSVGALLQQLLTGAVPDGHSLPSMLARCDIRFDEIVRKATHPMPELRYRAAAEMAQDLHALAKSLSRPQPSPTTTTRSLRPQPTPTGTAGYAPNRGNPTRRPVAGRSSTVVVKKSGNGAFATIALVAFAAAAIYFVSKPGGLTLRVGSQPPVPVPVVKEAPPRPMPPLSSGLPAVENMPPSNPMPAPAPPTPAQPAPTSVFGNSMK